ncbi:MAG: DUF308 domain-containing protein [Tateyamaria sp.]|nr:DUF308 domain-containing protein [Tateyamaria sp.]
MKIWVKWLVLGVLSLAFGIFVLANPVAASIAVTTLAGIMFILAGAFQVFGGFGEDGIFAKILGIALGILMLFLGLSLTLHPLEGMISLATLVTILFAASGITRLISAFQMQKTSFFWPMLVSGAFSVILAGYIVANFFEIAPSLLGLLLGIELLLNGMGLIILALFLRTNKNLINN